MIEHYWPFWLGGISIAGIAFVITVLTGRFLGVTKGFASACSIVTRKPYFHQPVFGGPWGTRTFFTAGIILGGLIAALTSGGWNPSFMYGKFDVIYGSHLGVKALVLVIGGFLWGYGSRMANGCTSGNSISGLSKGSLASLVTTLGFMVSGIVVTYIINFIAGEL